jgi:hypothetical protein
MTNQEIKMLNNIDHYSEMVIKGFALGPIIYFIERFIWNDWDFLTTLVLLILCDGMVMAIRSLLDRKYEIIHAFRDFAMKTLALTLTVLCTGLLDNAVIKGEASLFIEIVNSGFYAVLLLFVGISILKNIYGIYPLDFINDLLNRIDKSRRNELDK